MPNIYPAKGKKLVVALALALSICIGFAPMRLARAEVRSITLSPDLDMSYFGNYTLGADVAGTPDSVTADLYGVNGDGNPVWDFSADGTPYAASVQKSLAHDVASGNWVTTVRPDSIYPQVFYAPSSVTWNNDPYSIPIRKNSYHAMRFANPFTMVPQMTMFIELNTIPNSANSGVMEVYLAPASRTSSSFTSEWRHDPDVEMVAGFGATDPYDHTHSVNSAHRLVELESNPDATVGTKHIDVSGGFWLLLYDNAAQDARGWTLKYAPPSLCANVDGWYVGSQAGWEIAPQAGCPDVHYHIARRGASNADGMRASVSAVYSGSGTVSLERTFSFEPLPNMAPNPTEFLSPTENAVINADGGPVTISWDPASDPNNDTLSYSVSLDDGLVLTPLVTGSSGLSFAWDPAGTAPGTYGLLGEVCDNGAPSLCSSFRLANFTVLASTPVHQLISVSIASSGTDLSLAVPGNVITLSFEATGDIATGLTADFYSGGTHLGAGSLTGLGGNAWMATYTVIDSNPSEAAGFVIAADRLDREYSETTDGSFVDIRTETDRFPPNEPYEGGDKGGGSDPSYQGQYVPDTLPLSAPSNAVGDLPVLSENGAGLGADKVTALPEDGSIIEALKAILPPQETLAREPFLKDLRLTMSHLDVLRLQRYLNANGYTLAGSGAGSPGKETSYFGLRTWYALIRLQKKLLGYGSGFFGPITRAKLNGL